MIGQVVTFALPTLPDATAPIAAAGFAEILAIQSPLIAALPMAPATAPSGVTDPIAAPFDLAIPATVSTLSPIEQPTVPVVLPTAPAPPARDVVAPSPNVATGPVSEPPHGRRPVIDKRDEDSVAPVDDAATVPIRAWLAPQPPIQPAEALPERETVTPPMTVAARVPVDPEITRDADAPTPDIARPLPSLPDTRRMVNVAVPRQANQPADLPIEVSTGRATTNLASVVTQSTAAAPGPTPDSAAPDRAPPIPVLPTTTALDPVRSPVVEAVPTSTAATLPAKVEHTAPDTGPAITQPLPVERIASAPEGLSPAHPQQPKPDDLSRTVEAIPVNASAAPPALPTPDVAAPARPASPAPIPRDPAPTFAIATPALGEVSAAVTARHDGTGERLHVHFAVERDATAVLIAGHDGLDRALAAAGARLDTVSVEVRSSAERSGGDAPRPDPRAPDPDRPRRPPPPRSPQIRVTAPGRDRFA